MSTLSVPISAEQDKFIRSKVKEGFASNKASVVRVAIDKLAEDEAVRAVLDAQREPNLRGDLKDLMKKI